MTTYLYGDRPSPRIVSSRWRAIEATGQRIDQAIVSRHEGETFNSAGAGDRLSAGDTLVVEEVGCLGESYAEIVDAILTLMRRKVRLRSLEDNLVFDGEIADAGLQAARDALACHVAAASQARRAAKRAAMEAATGVAEFAPSGSAPPRLEREGVGLQIRVIAAQLGTLILVTLGASVALPVSRESYIVDPPAPAREARAESEPRIVTPPVAPRFSEFARPDQPGAPEAAAPAKAGDAPGPLGLPVEEARLVHAAVAQWRSAQVRSGAVEAVVGGLVPPSVRLAVFPRRLAAQHPGLRGHKFIVVEGHVVVVDPATRQIVARFEARRRDD
ncbi:MAG: hypothetical protein CTY15_14475 [Methylocystis sp.]|nr:MAG: hypothetical protein CTY15_14475 [Methylocystis sp.]